MRPMRPMQLTTEQIAQIAHDANMGYSLSRLDFSQGPWSETPDWVRESAIAMVEYVRKNPNAKPEEVHSSWSKNKMKDGWTLGPRTDPFHKTHSCLVQYENLPESQKAKYYIFLAVVRSCLNIT